MSKRISFMFKKELLPCGNASCASTPGAGIPPPAPVVPCGGAAAATPESPDASNGDNASLGEMLSVPSLPTRRRVPILLCVLCSYVCVWCVCSSLGIAVFVIHHSMLYGVGTSTIQIPRQLPEERRMCVMSVFTDGEASESEVAVALELVLNRLMYRSVVCRRLSEFSSPSDFFFDVRISSCSEGIFKEISSDLLGGLWSSKLQSFRGSKLTIFRHPVHVNTSNVSNLVYNRTT